MGGQRDPCCYQKTVGTLCYDDYKGINNQYVEQEKVIMENEYVVRRLTPTECARLQGFPDFFCEGIPHSDSEEYKMWGNGVALPCVLYVMENVKRYLNENNNSAIKWLEQEAEE